jgi:hypothetical protein
MPFDGFDYGPIPNSGALLIINRMIDMLAEPSKWVKGVMRLEGIDGYVYGYCMAGALRQAAHECVPTRWKRWRAKQIVRKQLNAWIRENHYNFFASLGAHCGIVNGVIVTFNDNAIHREVMQGMFETRNAIRRAVAMKECCVDEGGV